jgi:rhodanese-related sulfurtransferase
MKAMRTFLVLLTALLSLGAAASAQDAPIRIEGAKTVSGKQAFKLIAKTPNIVIIDNRKAEDYAAGHIEGAIRLIDTEIDAESLAKHINSKDTPVLFYCNGVKSGRAAKATEKALQLGYTKVYYYALGMDEWNFKRYPLVQ